MKTARFHFFDALACSVMGSAGRDPLPRYHGMQKVA